MSSLRVLVFSQCQFLFNLTVLVVSYGQFLFSLTVLVVSYGQFLFSERDEAQVVFILFATLPILAAICIPRLLGLTVVVKQIHILNVIVKQIHICTTEPSCNYLKAIVAVQLAEVQEYLEFSQLPVKIGNSK